VLLPHANGVPKILAVLRGDVTSLALQYAEGGLEHEHRIA
jgi:hypothetical protein